MERKQSALPYDIDSPTSIFEYRKNLLGRTLSDFKWEYHDPSKGKSSLEQMVEFKFFLLETNNYATDFSKTEIEQKCTPLKNYLYEMVDEGIKLSNFYLKRITNCHYTTKSQQSILRTQLQYTNYSYSNLWNHQRGRFPNHIQTNVLNEEYLQGS